MWMPECPEACAVSPSGRVSAPDVRNALTIDVEDYYQVASFENRVSRADWHRLESRVRSSTELLLETLEAAGVRGTFFVLGWAAQQQPRLVQEIYEAGHEIGCHSYWHRLVYRQTAEDFRDDLRRARDVLQETIGDAVVAYRAPCFSITRRSLWALDVLIEEGFVIDSSIFPTFHDRYGIAGAPAAPHWIARPAGAIREFPLAVYRLCGYPLPIGGGGYFRLYPYMFTRHGLRAINAQGRPVAVYLHPWEVDPEQPRLAWAGLNAFRHYVNLQHTRERLRRLLADFSLSTLSEVFAHVEAAGRLATWDLRLAAA
jgi:polysaccharide deacetylase family protein (PEP-CTERM system associated)